MLVNSKKFLSFSLNCDETLREWTGQSMKLFLVYSTDLALKVTVCIRRQNLLELFFFSMLVFVLFCFLSFVVICLFISCFLLFCFFFCFCYFVTWYTKREHPFKVLKRKCFKRVLEAKRCPLLAKRQFFFSLSSRWEFSHRDDKEAGTFFIFFIQRFNILKIEQTFGNHVLSGQLYGKLGDFNSLSNGMRFFYTRNNFHGTSGVIDMLFQNGRETLLFCHLVLFVSSHLYFRSQTPSRPEDTPDAEVHEKYIELMCRYQPDLVHSYLRNTENYRLEETLAVCLE